jgi:hypothetical protein
VTPLEGSHPKYIWIEVCWGLGTMLTQVDDEGREFAVASISYYIPMLNKNP